MQYGPLHADPQMVATFLYLQEAPQQPVDAPDEWFAPIEGAEPVVTVERTHLLLVGLGDLLLRLLDLRKIHDGMVSAGIVFTEDRPAVWTEDAVQFEFYEAAKATFGESKAEIREFFMHLYQLVTQTPSGPRWGQFVMLFGLDEFIQMLQKRFDNPLG